MVKTHKMATLLAVIMALVLLAPVGATADTYSIADIMDNTWVQGYYHGTPSAPQNRGYGWQDIIATTPSAWDIKKVGVTWDNVANQVTMQIFTNYRPTGEAGAGQADIALRLGGSTTWGYGISLAGVSGLGTVSRTLVPVTQWLDSGSIGWSSGNWIYAGAYGDQNDQNNLHTPIPIRIAAAGASLGAATVTYVNLGTSSNRPSNYEVDVVFPWLTGFNNFDFLVKSGTCGNETMFGTAALPGNFQPIPVPGSVLLLGTGLVGLVMLRKTRRS